MQHQTWHAMLETKGETLWLWVSNGSGHDVLRAALPRTAAHPRALLTILEGLALYSGNRLFVVHGADPQLNDGQDGFGNEAGTADSPLVMFFPRQILRPPHRVDVCVSCRGHQPEDDPLADHEHEYFRDNRGQRSPSSY